MKPGLLDPNGDYIRKIIKEDGLRELVLSHLNDLTSHNSKKDKENIKNIIENLNSHLDFKNQLHLNSVILNKINASDTVVRVDSISKRLKADLESHKNSEAHLSVSKQNRWNDTYTKSEVINLLKGTISGLSWNEDALTYNHLMARFSNKPIPNGYICFVIDEKSYYYAIQNKFRKLEILIAEATDTVSGLMSATDKKKLYDIQDNANNYTHPDDHYTRHVSDEQINYFSNKADKDIATPYSSGLMSGEDKGIIEAIKNETIKNIEVTSIPVYFNNENNKLITITRNEKLSCNGMRFITKDASTDTDVFTMAFKNAVNGSTICIDSGTYVLDSTINIKGSGLSIIGSSGTHILNKGSLKSIITLNGSNNLIRDINFNMGQHSISNGSAIILSGNNNILDNVFCEYGTGVVLSGNQNKIHNCLFEYCTNGIYLESVGLTSLGNIITNNAVNRCVIGISIVGGNKLNTNNIVSNNICFGSSIGIKLSNTTPGTIMTKSNIITGNNITLSTADIPVYGTSQYTILVSSSDNIITNNIVKGKDVAIIAGSNNIVSGNLV